MVARTFSWDVMKMAIFNVSTILQYQNNCCQWAFPFKSIIYLIDQTVYVSTSDKDYFLFIHFNIQNNLYSIDSVTLNCDLFQDSVVLMMNWAWWICHYYKCMTFASWNEVMDHISQFSVGCCMLSNRYLLVSNQNIHSPCRHLLVMFLEVHVHFLTVELKSLKNVLD